MSTSFTLLPGAAGPLQHACSPTRDGQAPGSTQLASRTDATRAPFSPFGVTLSAPDLDPPDPQGGERRDASTQSYDRHLPHSLDGNRAAGGSKDGS
jgi:hypothetical protein